MLDIKFVRENPDIVKTAMKNKNVDLDLDAFLKLDGEISKMKTEQQQYLEEKNALSAQIPTASASDKESIIARSKEVGAKADALSKTLTDLETKWQDVMYQLPTIPSSDTPIGKDDEDNVVIRQVGRIPKFDFTPLSQTEILEKNNWADFKRVAQVCGSRSYSLKGDAARLELALQMYMMDKMREKGFTMVTVPSMVKEAALFGTGHFPGAREDVYYLEKDDIYLSGTAEIVLTSLHSGEILTEADLPILYAGISPCFRREAGSAGKDVKGLIRVHQFNKVEQYVICKNDLAESDKWHKILLECSEEMMQEMEIPYQVIACCTGDMGLGKYRMNDIEAWVPSENKYRETHSCSTLHEFQARRADLRYRADSDGKVKYAHTLNNTGIATPRFLVPFLENHQLANGKVKIPAKLQPYMRGVKILGDEPDDAKPKVFRDDD